MFAPETPIEDVPLAVVDVETTGLDPQTGDRVCEIAVLRVDPGEEPRLWVSLVNPERPIGAGAQAVNGIADEDVADAPLFGTLIAEINAGLDGTVLVAHNVPFDVGFLRAEVSPRRACGSPTVPTLDTLELARRCFRFRRNGLGDVAWQLGVSPPGLAPGGGRRVGYLLRVATHDRDTVRRGPRHAGRLPGTAPLPAAGPRHGRERSAGTAGNRRARRASHRYALRRATRD